METTTGQGSPLRGGPEPSITPNPNVEVLELFERVSTRTRAGAAVSIASDYDFGEAIELRYSSALADTQFQGIFLQVDTSVANNSTIRAAEFVGRQGSAVAVGTLEGIHAQAQVRSSGNVTAAYGVDGQISVFDGYSGTLALAAAIRAKFQTEGTITEGYGVLIENEAVDSGVLLSAAIGVKTTSEAALFGSLIDSRGAGLEVINTNQVRLISFRDAAGTDKMLVYDPDSATAVSVANYA